MPFHLLPDVNSCCGCVTDLKTAVAIIVVLGIVTSPALSWAIVRHSYVIRVSCYVTSSEGRPDVVDINLNNVLSFGFGANAGLGPSCLRPKSAGGSKTTEAPKIALLTADANPASPHFIKAVKGFGWIVLISDIVFMLASVFLLIRLFKNAPFEKVVKIYMWTAVVSIVLSCIYGLLYVIICVAVGGAFPIFEFIFVFFDFGLCLVWYYFFIVIRSYIRKSTAQDTQRSNMIERYYENVSSFLRNIYEYTFRNYDSLSKILSWLLRVKRCCYCTRNLRVATIFIIIWSMLVATHGVNIAIWPHCYDLYRGQMSVPLLFTKWTLFASNLILLASSFAFLMGIFFKYPIAGIVYIFCATVTAFFSFVHAILFLIKLMQTSECTQSNPSDPVALLMYFILWIYFIFVVNSYVEEMEETK